jgi:signal transduction histidine kinase
LKYLPPQSPIQFRILQREDLLGTSFTVTSQLTRLDLLDEAIFTRRGRGAGAQGSGGGLGLYLVKKVAEAHGGSVSYFIHDDAKVTFDLFIPDE